MLQAGECKAQSSNSCNGAQGEDDDFVSERHTFNLCTLYCTLPAKAIDPQAID
jgi:hypothetical protein